MNILRGGVISLGSLVLAACGTSEPVDPNLAFDPYADYGLFLNVLTPGQSAWSRK